MSLNICTTCNNHYLSSDKGCPHCCSSFPNRRRALALATILGVGLVACGEKEDDTSTEPVAEPATENDYGVAEGPPDEMNDGEQ